MSPLLSECMRQDMAKILVERPRTGGGAKYPRGVDRGPLDHHPLREPIKSPLQIEKLRRRIYFGWRALFYVDPTSRRLCEMQHQSRHRQKLEPFLVECDGRSFKQINGIWYEVELAPLEATAGHVWMPWSAGWTAANPS